MNRTISKVRLLPWLILLGTLLPAAAAQDIFDGAEPTGVISGTLDGTEVTWHTYDLVTPDGKQNTASYSVIMDMFHSYSLQGHQGSNLIEGTVSISFTSLTGSLANCPCELPGDVTYWTTPSMFEDVYLNSDAVITVLEIEELADGAYRMSGTVQAELEFFESLTSAPEPTGQVATVDLEFNIDRVSFVDLDLDLD